MQTKIEAPVQEPRGVQGQDGVEVEGVSRVFKTRGLDVSALDGLSLRVHHHEVV
ncbi:MAG: hypothetical protein QOI98_443, partial [Solirubrobacteraceae bacterium]|nr:hypothetical protein [Solirubrobacteraceae bacterium]